MSNRRRGMRGPSQELLRSEIETVPGPGRKSRTAATPRIQSLARAAAILDVVAERSPVSLTEVSRATKLNKTTSFNLLASLQAVGLVSRQRASKGYVLGLTCLRLGKIVQGQLELRAAARASLLRLCRETSETVNLAVPYLFDTLIVDSLEGSHGLRATSYAGARGHYHSTACGKVILAFVDAETRDFLLAGGTLPAQTHNTITDPKQLARILDKVRREGYALDVEENELGGSCVAAPIFDPAGDVLGAVSISGPTARLSKPNLLRMVPLLKEEMTQIGRRLAAQSGGEGRNGHDGQRPMKSA
jgi:IclR family acetate operon transcriptional repressor